MKWLENYRAAAVQTDRLKRTAGYKSLLAAGLYGEAGSLLAEMKKEKRERDAYPRSRGKLLEELGDFLWYFVRLVESHNPALFSEFKLPAEFDIDEEQRVQRFLQLGIVCGEILQAVTSNEKERLDDILIRAWKQVTELAQFLRISLQDSAKHNLEKNNSRWPKKRKYIDFFDEGYPPEEQLPRHLTIDFIERKHGNKTLVTLRCNNLNFGDHLTDNIQDPDGYRYHDIFHFSYATFLGWSPVMRSLLRCKRKSNPKVDESEDGARAIIIDEAISAMVFSRAKTMGDFVGLQQIDYDLLKMIQNFTQGYEIDKVPLWQWERAILSGYEVFRLLKANKGGQVRLDLKKRQLSYLAPPRT